MKKPLLPIRILQVIGHMNRGGAETMIMNLYREVDRSIIQFDFVEHSDKEAAYDSEIIQNGGRIFHCPVYKPHRHLQYERWWREFFIKNSSEYQIVHGHIGSTAAIYLSIAKKFGCITIAHSHSALKGSLAYRLYSFPTRWIADYFFGCGSEAVSSRFGRRILCAGKCTIVRNGINLEKYTYSDEKRTEIRNKYSIPMNAIVVGHVGRFSAVKNHKYLINVFKAFLDLFPEAYLLLVGEGEERQSIEAKTIEMAISKHVIFAGGQKDTSPFYSAMDLFMFPSIGEGLPLALVEAQTSSLPCYISNTIPHEAALVEELVFWQDINDSPNNWAKAAYSFRDSKRINRTQEIARQGYDIKQTAKQIQYSYLKMLGQNLDSAE